ncbi:hypothetical protein [Nocardia sp. BMG111209]|uniref:hypothetical protein n=1 Tax=Nocardia sp. BMG111209 TaxID=1160137 RepID=UPI0003819B33|nr:hypothetical protein [Nocardia sp. BMG111209]
MNVPVSLRLAAESVPTDARSEAGLTVADVHEYLRFGEWEMALGILQEFEGLRWQSAEYWKLLAGVAQQLSLPHDADWCRWRAAETRCGSIIRADLWLLPPESGGRRIAVPGSGLRPMWATGDDTVGLRLAQIRVEFAPEIPVGGRGRIRLLPLTPDAWRHLRPGDVITMHEQRPAVGSATLLEVQQR